MSDIIIRFDNVGKRYKDKKVFDNLNMQIREGDMVSIIGKSGIGKSTLLNIMGLIDTNTEGDFFIFDKKNIDINSKDAMLLRRKKIGYLFQNFALIEDESVYDNLLIALKYAKMTKQEKNDRIEEALNKVNLVQSINQKIYKLSGGEQQRIAIARLILKESVLILADEPTGSLDEENRNMIISFLKEFNKEGKTIVIVTHDKYVASECKRVINIGEN